MSPETEVEMSTIAQQIDRFNLLMKTMGFFWDLFSTILDSARQVSLDLITSL